MVGYGNASLIFLPLQGFLAGDSLSGPVRALPARPESEPGLGTDLAALFSLYPDFQSSKEMLI